MLARDGREVQVRIGPRVSPLQVMPDGSYVMAGGLLVGFPVKLALESDGVPHIEIVGVETVRRNTGLQHPWSRVDPVGPRIRCPTGPA